MTAPLDPLSPTESRWLDGALPPDEAAAMAARIAADPALAARLDAWRRAMDLWREDAARTPVPDPGEVAGRVLATGRTAEVPDPVTARRYAAAALVLLGLGAAGSAATAWTTPALSAPPVAETIGALEGERIAFEGAFEALSLRVAAPDGK